MSIACLVLLHVSRADQREKVVPRLLLAACEILLAMEPYA